MCDGWGSISPELLLIIMKHLKAADLAQASHVNYHWKVVSEDDSLWKPLLIKDYDLPSKSPLRICNRWIDEYKLMKWAPPTVLGETLFECDDGLSDVCFSPNGHFFCTTTNDGRFKLWTATMPTYFVDGHSLRQNLSWDRIVSAEFSPDSYFLLFCGVKQNGNGEIAVFEISEDDDTVNFCCRVPNNPPEIGACWYNAERILSGDIYYMNLNSIIGTSVSKIWLCSVLTDWEYQQESLYCYIFRILNRQDGFCQMLRVAHTVSARLRGIVELSAEAVQLHSTLSERLDDLLVEKDCDERERKKQLTERLDEIYQTNESPCDQCLAFHFGLTESEGESDNEISEAKNDSTQSPLPIEYCYCNCHDAQDRLLIYAIGSEQFPPHVVAFKIIDAKMISRKLKGIEDVVPPSSSNVSREPAENLDNVLAQIEALLSSLDKPDYLIDMRAYIMGLSLSDDEKFLYVSLTHDRYEGNMAYAKLAEIRVINLVTMLPETSYFGHIARMGERFGCSVANHYVACAAQNGAVLWSREHGSMLGRYPHSGPASAVALSPTGDMAVSVGKIDGKIKIWRSKRTLQKLKTPTMHNDFM